MKNLSRLLFLFFALTAAIAACNDDDDDEPEFKDSTNINANASLPGINGVADDKTTHIRAVAARLEIPRLRNTGNNLFLVHSVPGRDINYCVEWDCSLKAQRWSAYRWDRSNSDGYVGRSDEFQEDPLIPAPYRTTLEDHKRNGHDRGHIVASGDRQRSVQENEQTFYLSNMHPQLNKFNAQGIWLNLENRLRNIYNKDSFRDTLYVVKGGTIDNGNYTWVKGESNELVCPKYFFMALLCKKNNDRTNGGYAAIGFWMEHKANTDTNFKKYAVSIDRLEELTGIDFFCNLPDAIEEAVERGYSDSVWKL